MGTTKQWLSTFQFSWCCTVIKGLQNVYSSLRLKATSLYFAAKWIILCDLIGMAYHPELCVFWWEWGRMLVDLKSLSSNQGHLGLILNVHWFVAKSSKDLRN